MKLRYRRCQMDRTVDIIDEEVHAHDGYKDDFMNAMRPLSKLWEYFPSETISNCWVDTRLQSVSDGCVKQSLPSASAGIECTMLQKQISLLISMHAQMAIDKFANAPDGKDCLEDLMKKRQYLMKAQRA